MKLENSKYLSKSTEKNPWREVEISESMLIAALEFTTVPRLSLGLKKGEHIERVIVGEPINGVYPLSVAIISHPRDDDDVGRRPTKRKEAKED